MRCPSLCVCATPWASLYGDKLCGMFDVGLVVGESWMGSGRTGEAEVVEQREGAQKRVVQPQSVEHSANNAAVQGSSPCMTILLLSLAYHAALTTVLRGFSRFWRVIASAPDLLRTQPNLHVTYNGRGKHRLGAASAARLRPTDSNLPERQDEVSELCVCLCGMFDVGSVVSESWVGSGRTGEAEVVEQREGAQKRVVQPQSVEHSANNAAVQGSSPCMTILLLSLAYHAALTTVLRGFSRFWRVIASAPDLLRTQPNLHVTYNGRGKHRLGAASAARLRPTDSNLPERQDEVSELCVCLCGMFDVGSVVSESWVGSGRTGEAEVVEQREGAQKRVVQPQSVEHSANNAATSYALNRTFMSPTTGVANTDSELPRRLDSTNGLEYRSWLQDLPERQDEVSELCFVRRQALWDVRRWVVVSESWVGSGRTGEAEVVEQREGAQKRVVQPQSVEHSANNAAVQGSSPCMTILLLSLAYHAALTTVLRGFSRFWRVIASAPDLLRTQPNLHVTYNGRGKHRLGAASAARLRPTDSNLPERQDEVSELCFVRRQALWDVRRWVVVSESWVGSGRTGEAEVVEQREGAQKRVVQPQSTSYALNRTFMSPTTGVANTDSELPRRLDPTNGLEYRSWLQDLPERQDEVSEPWADGEAEVVEQREGAQKRVVQPQSVEHSANNAAVQDLLRTQPNLMSPTTGVANTDSELPRRLDSDQRTRVSRQDEVSEPVCVCATPWASLYGDKLCGMFDVGLVVGESWMGSGRTGEAEVVEQREGAQKRVVQPQSVEHSANNAAVQDLLRTQPNLMSPTTGVANTDSELPRRLDSDQRTRVSFVRRQALWDVRRWVVVSESWVGSGRTGEAEVVEQREGAQKRVVQHLLRTQPNLNITYNGRGKHRLGAASAARQRPTDSSIGPGCKISRSAKMRCPSLCVCATPWASLYGDKLCGMFDVGSVVSESWVGSGRTGEAEVVEQREGAQKRVVQRACVYLLRTQPNLNITYNGRGKHRLGAASAARLRPTDSSIGPGCKISRSAKMRCPSLGRTGEAEVVEQREGAQKRVVQHLLRTQPNLNITYNGRGKHRLGAASAARLRPTDSSIGPGCKISRSAKMRCESWVGSGRTGEAEVVEQREGAQKRVVQRALYGDKLCGMFDVGSVVSESWVGSGRTGEAEVVEQREGAQKRVVQRACVYLLRTQPNLNITYNGRGKHRLGAASAARLRPTDSSIGPGCKISRSAKMRCPSLESWVGSGRTGEAEVVEQREGAQKRVVQPQSVEHSANNAAVQGSSPCMTILLLSLAYHAALTTVLRGFSRFWRVIASAPDLLRTQPNLNITYNGRGKHRLGAASAARLRPTDSSIGPGCKISRSAKMRCPSLCVCVPPRGLVCTATSSVGCSTLGGCSESWVGSGRTGEAEVVEQREGAQKRVVQPQSVEHSANNAAVQDLLRTQPNLHVTYNGRGKHRLGAASAARLRPTDSNLPERQDEVSEPVCVCATPWASLYGDKLCGMFDVGSVVSESWVGSGRTGEAEVVEQREGAQKRVVQPQSVEHSANNAAVQDLLRTQPNLMSPTTGVANTDSELPRRLDNDQRTRVSRQDEVSEPVCVCATPWASLYGDKLCGMFDVGSVVSESWVGSGRTGEAEVVEQREGAQKRVVQPQSVEHSANNAAVQDLLRTQPNLHVTYNGRGKHRLGAASAARQRPTDSNLPERQDEVSEPFVRRQALWDVRRWVVVSESWVGSGRTGEAEVVEQREGAQKRVVQPQSVEHSANNAAVQGSSPCMTILLLSLAYHAALTTVLRGFSRFWRVIASAPDLLRTQPNLHVTYNGRGKHRLGAASAARQRPTDSNLPERQDEVSEPVCVCATPWASLYGDKLCGMFDVGSVVSESWVGSGRTGEAEVVEQREGAQKRVVQHLLRTQPNLHVTYNGRGKHRLGAASAARLRPTDSSIGPGCKISRSAKMSGRTGEAEVVEQREGAQKRVVQRAPLTHSTEPHVTYNGRGKHRLGAASAARLRPTDSSIGPGCKISRSAKMRCPSLESWVGSGRTGEAEVVEQREGAQKRVVQRAPLTHSTEPHVTYNGRGKHRLGAASAARLRPTDSSIGPGCKISRSAKMRCPSLESWVGSGRTGEAEVVEQREGAQKRVVQRAPLTHSTEPHVTYNGRGKHRLGAASAARLRPTDSSIGPGCKISRSAKMSGRTGEAEVVEQREGAQKRVVQPQSVEHSANNAAVQDLLRTQPNLHVTYNGRGKHRLGAASAARLRPTDSNLPERQDEVSEPVCVCATPWASLYGDKLCGMFDVGLVVGESWVGSGRTGEAEVVEQREGAQKRVVQPQSVEHSANNAAVQDLLRTQPNLHVTYNGRGKHRLGAASAARLRPTDSNLPERQDEVSEPVCVCATPWASLYGDKLCGMFDVGLVVGESWMGSGRTGEAEVVEQREGAQKRVVQPQSVEHSANNAAVQDLLRTQPNLHVTYNGRGKHRLGAASAARLRPTDSNLPERQDEVSEPFVRRQALWDVRRWVVVSESWVGSGRTGEAEVVEQREGAQKRVVQPQSVEHSANNAAVQDLLRTQPNLHVTYNGRGKHRLGAASAARLRPTDSNLPERQDEVSEPVCVCATPWASLYGDKLCGMFDVGSVVSESWVGSGRTGEAEVVEQREGAQKRVVQPQSVEHSANNAAVQDLLRTQPNLHVTYNGRGKHRLGAASAARLRPTDSNLPERQDEVSEPVCVCATPWASLYGDKLCGMFDVGLVVGESWMGSGRTGEAEVVEQREGAQKRVVQRACVYLLRTQPNLHVTYNGRGKHRLGAASAARLRPTDSNLPERQDEVSEPVCVCATPWASLYGDKLCGMFDVVEQREGAQKRVVQPQSVEHSANNAATSYALNRTSMSPTTGVANTDSDCLGGSTPTNGLEYRSWLQDLPERQDEVSEPFVRRQALWDVRRWVVVSESWVGSGRTGEAEVVEQREGAQKRVVQPQSVEHSANNAAVQDLLRTQPNLHVTYNGRGKHRLGAASAARLRPTDSSIGPGCKISRSAKMRCPSLESWVGSGRTGEAEVVEQREGAQKRVVQRACTSYALNRTSMSPTTGVANTDSDCLGGSTPTNGLEYRSWLQDLPERQDEVSEPSWVGSGRTGEAEVVEQREGAQKRVVQRACTSYALNRTSMSPTTGVANTDSDCLGGSTPTNGLEYRSWLQDLPERQDEVSEPSWVGSGRTGEAEVVEQREGAQKRVVQRACTSYALNRTSMSPTTGVANTDSDCLGGSTPTNGLEYRSWLQDLPERQDEVSEPVCVCATPWASFESWVGSGRTGEAEVVEQREGAQKRVVQRAPLTHSTEPPCHLQRAWQTPTRNCLGGSTPTNGLEYRSWLQDLPERQDEVSEPVCVCATPWASLYGDKLCGMFDVGLVVGESWMGSGRTGEAEVVEQREGAQKRVVQPQSVEHSANNAAVQDLLRTQPNLHVTYNGRGKHRLGTASAARLRPTDSNLPERQDEVSEPFVRRQALWDVRRWVVVSESWVGSGRTGEAEVVEQREGAQKRVVQPQSVEHSANNAATSYALNRTSMSPTTGVANTDSDCLGGSTPTNGLEYRSWLQDLPERQDEVSEPFVRRQALWDVRRWVVVSESWVGSGRTGEAEVVEQREGAQKRVVQPQSVEHSANNAAVQDLLRTQPNLHVTYNGRGKHRLGTASAARLRPTDSSIGPGCKISRSAKMSWVGSGRTGEAEVVEQREGAQKRVVQPQSVEHSANNAAVQDLLRTQPNLHVTYNGRGKHRLGTASAARLRPTDSNLPERQDEVSEPFVRRQALWDVRRWVVVSESWVGSGRTGEAEVVEQREGAQKRVVQPQSVEHSANNAAVQDLLRTQPNLHVTYNGRGKHRLGTASAARLRPTDSSIGPGCKISRSAKMRCPSLESWVGSGRTGEAEVVEQREGAQKRVVQRACVYLLRTQPNLHVTYNGRGKHRLGTASAARLRPTDSSIGPGCKISRSAKMRCPSLESWVGSGRTGEAEVVEQREGAQKRVVQRACVYLLRTQPNLHVTYNGRGKHRLGTASAARLRPTDSSIGPGCKISRSAKMRCPSLESWVGSGRTGEAEVVEQREGAQKRVVQRACVYLLRTQPNLHVTYNGRGKHRLGTASAARLRPTDSNLPERQDEVSEPVCVCATPWASLYGDKLCGMFDVVEQREGAQKRVVQPQSVEHSANNAAVQDLLRTQPNLHVTYNGRGKHRLGTASAARLRPTDSNLPERQDEVSEPVCVCATPWASLYGDKLCGMFDVGSVVSESWVGSGRTGEAEVVEQREGAQKRVVQPQSVEHSANNAAVQDLLRTQPNLHVTYNGRGKHRLGTASAARLRPTDSNLPERQDEVSEPVCVCATPWASLYGDKLCGMFDVGLVVSESWVGSGRTGEAEVVEQREGAQKRVVQRAESWVGSGRTGEAEVVEQREGAQKRVVQRAPLTHSTEPPCHLQRAWQTPTRNCLGGSTPTNGLEYRSWLQDLPERQDEVSEPVCVCATPWARVYGDKLSGMFDVGLIVSESWVGSGRTGEAEVVEQREGAQKRVVQPQSVEHSANNAAVQGSSPYLLRTQPNLHVTYNGRGKHRLGTASAARLRPTDSSIGPGCKISRSAKMRCPSLESWVGSGRTGEAEVVEQREGAQKRVVQRACVYLLRTQPNLHVTYNGRGKHRLGTASAARLRPTDSSIGPGCKISRSAKMRCPSLESWVGSGRTGEAEVVEQREGAQKRVVQRACVYLLRTQPNLHVTYNGRGKHRLGTASAARLRPTDSSIGPGCKISRSAKMRCPSLESWVGSGRTGEAEVVEQREGAQKRVVQRACVYLLRTQPNLHVTYNGRGKHRLGTASAARLRPTDSSIGPGCKISRSAKMRCPSLESWVGSGRTGEAEVVEQREGAQKRVVQRACVYLLRTQPNLHVTYNGRGKHRLGTASAARLRPTDSSIGPGCKISRSAKMRCPSLESWVGSGRTGEAEVVEQREGAQKRVVQRACVYLLRTQPNLHVTYNGRGKHRLGTASAARLRPTDSSIGPGCKISRSAKMRCPSLESWVGSGRTGEAEVVEQREGAQKRVVQRAPLTHSTEPPCHLQRAWQTPTRNCLGGSTPTNGLEYRSWLQDLPERQDEVSEPSWVGSGRTGEAEVVEQREGAQKRVVQRAGNDQPVGKRGENGGI
ncbi:hypothetical protein PInf_014106 [Phytophthora infestans]|nr:hypothetical protein PInf_014106 [Phytophthora infestans]